MSSRTWGAALLAAALSALAVAVAVSADRGSSAASAKSSLFAALAGKNEIGTDGRKGAGDRDGRGSFSATVDGGQLCFGLVVKNIAAPVAAHIHKGTAGKNGGVVVPLTPPGSGDPGGSSGCVEVERSLLKAILKNPARYYANVHNADFPGGAVRGQLFAKSP